MRTEMRLRLIVTIPDGYEKMITTELLVRVWLWR